MAFPFSQMKKVLYISQEKYYDETENSDENSSLAESIRENRPFYVLWNGAGSGFAESHVKTISEWL